MTYHHHPRRDAGDRPVVNDAQLVLFGDEAHAASRLKSTTGELEAALAAAHGRLASRLDE